jgi:hypothetical protein
MTERLVSYLNTLRIRALNTACPWTASRISPSCSPCIPASTIWTSPCPDRFIGVADNRPPPAYRRGGRLFAYRENNRHTIYIRALFPRSVLNQDSCLSSIGYRTSPFMHPVCRMHPCRISCLKTLSAIIPSVRSRQASGSYDPSIALRQPPRSNTPDRPSRSKR